MRYTAPRRGGGAAAEIGAAGYRALAGFRYALRLFFAFSEAAARSAGLTPRQYQALLAVRGWDGSEAMTIGELAERLQLRHHSAVGLVQRLVTAGLMTRRASPRDRRRAVLGLTRRGDRLLASLASVHRAELRRQRPHLEALLESL